MDSSLRLIVGLGNPGRQYEATRHNVGFMIIDRMALRLGAEMKENSRWQAELGAAGDLRLCKPLGFMNRSGAAVRAVADYYRVAPSETLVILDDAALPLGRLRIRRSGSAGGHNGIQSVIEHFGTQELPRLRVGIGAPSGAEMVGHVLGRFSSMEKETLELALDRAVEAVECIRAGGIESAMNLYN